MAGDWIKMRVGLTTNPKVMRLAECLLDDEKYLDWSGLAYGVQGYPPASEDESRNERHAALRVTRYVTVTALLRFWGYANEHEKNENIAGIFPEDVDEIVGVPGFARAIEVAGWATFLPAGGLSLPGFSEHNTSAGARSNGAERQKRYRENRRSEASRVTGKSDVTRDATVTPREEKRREEKKEQKILSSGDDGLPAEPKLKAPAIPYDDILAAYHDALPMLPAVRLLTDARRKKIKSRWHELAERQTPEYWRGFFAYAAKSDFLTGRNGKWTACNFDWLLEPSNHLKVAEGNYENGSRS